MKFSYALLKKLAPGIKDQKKFVEEFPLHAFEIEGIKDDTVDISIPANRYSDVSSHKGIALIVSAIFGGKIVEPKLAAIVKKTSSRKFGIKIAAKNLCKRYSGLYAEVSKVTASPRWMQDFLISCGLRPINGIVDVMNYIMLEIGQPLHAFDADLLKGAINVRLAKNSEKIETIDGNVFTLTGQDLVIVDDNGPIAIAGVKGGKRAEINVNTGRIIIEAANFDATNIYKTSRRQNLFTDASIRFAHGLSPASVETAIKRAAQLLKELYGAKIGDWLDINYIKSAKTVIKFDTEKFNRLIGLNLTEKNCHNYLKKLGFKINGKLVTAPLERTDVSIFEDLAEEIVNLYGYEKLPSTAPHIYLKTSGYEESIKFKDILRRILIGFGLSEVYNHSFVGEDGMVEIENPISKDKKYLRANLAHSLIKNIEDNFRFYETVKVFEIGKVFAPEEKAVIGIALGFRKGNPILDIKGLIEQTLQSVGLTDYAFVEEKNKLKIESDGVVIGYLQNFGENRAVAEIDLEKCAALVEEEKSYEPLAKYPSVMRDISLFVPADVRIGDIMAAIQRAAPKFLDDADMVDFYEAPSESIGKSGDESADEEDASKKSVTFRLVFQAGDHTLTDEEVGKEMEIIIATLQNEFDVEVR